MLPRTLEPEVMDSAEEARDYDAMDHAEVNRQFVDDLLYFAGRWPGPETWNVLDVGTGTAQIPIELCRRSSQVRVTGADLALQMLQLGQRNVIRAGFVDQIRLDHVDAKGLPFADGTFDCVMSNSIVHHIPEPLSALREMVRVLRPGGVWFVRDLLRPNDAATVDQFVTLYAGTASNHAREMFRASLHAALTLEELTALLREIGIDSPSLQQTSDRHWTIAARKP